MMVDFNLWRGLPFVLWRDGDVTLPPCTLELLSLLYAQYCVVRFHPATLVFYTKAYKSSTVRILQRIHILYFVYLF